ncbi:disintegrin and metalloproteinase domain-containing protein 21-like [Nannospalax galili]|uniref:disintegrin and metalloproteinase domain-containing protein 21-like n=1 Tax=Nannospalax galili TaxID=1026970 RepID=UPI0004ED4CFF|nr:disintegrin and metalloproteinase domain-containing protein 21-like [Nannospalax galili]
MAFTWTQAFLGDVFWLSMFWALLSRVWCFQGQPKWRFTTSEIVIPRKVPQRMGGSEMPDQLAYSMRFRGQRHVIHMKLKTNLLPRHFPIFTNDDQGAMQEDYPFVPRDCYYYSYLEGVPGSTATVDTCYGGLRGMLQVDDFTYEIKPLQTSSKFEHIVSLLMLEERTQESNKCNSDEIGEVANQFLEEENLIESPRAAPAYLWQLHMKHIRILYTLSNSLIKKNDNRTFMVESVLIMTNIADTIYKPSGLNVFVRAICLWNQNDAIDLVNQQPGSMLTDYGSLRTKFHGQLESSVAVILTGHKIQNNNYYANFNGMCNAYWGAILLHVARYHVFLAATTLAHALGHSLGMRHDRVGCVCFRRRNCVMNENIGLLDMLSNCSQAVIYGRINGWDTCLSSLNIPYTNFPYTLSRCGDKIHGESEQCDCGSFKECASSKCCNIDCTLTMGSVCSLGTCCLDCKFAPSGTICRDQRGICDLPEYCDGKSENCPEDFHIQDGTPCSAVSVCMAGNCSDRDTQCQALFGYQVHDGSPACYKELNRRGDRFGNCGVSLQRGGSKPVVCEDDNVFCGLLHCGDVTRVPGGGEHTTFHHIRVQDLKEEHCFGYDAHHGSEVPEMGLVVDGATCGPGKFCRRQNCTFHQDIGFDCDVSTCNFRGVCNSKSHCHCIYGWQPPSCDQRGMGGSEDSGPPPTNDQGLQAQIRMSINRILLVLFTRMILILVALLFGAILRAAIVDTEESAAGHPNPHN